MLKRLPEKSAATPQPWSVANLRKFKLGHCPLVCSFGAPSKPRPSVVSVDGFEIQERGLRYRLPAIVAMQQVLFLLLR